MSNNKIATYLLYAIGEIFLVVVGILIAVQIDNWNEQRKKQETVFATLDEIKRNLNDDIKELTFAEPYFRQCLYSNQFVLAHLEGEPVDDDSIGYHFAHLFGGGRIAFNTIGFETLKSIGMDQLKNDSLKTKLFNYYTQTLQYSQEQSEGDEAFIFDHLLPLLNTHISSKIAGEEAYPNNAEALKDNSQFKETLRFNIGYKELSLLLHTNTRKEIDSLIQLIDEVKQHK